MVSEMLLSSRGKASHIHIFAPGYLAQVFSSSFSVSWVHRSAEKETKSLDAT